MSVAPQVEPILHELDEARRRAGVSKSALAGMLDAHPSSVRRLLGTEDVNPLLSTVAAVADALGHQLQVVPKSREAAVAAVEQAHGLSRAAQSLRRLGGAPFTTILADPPWRFLNRTGKVAPEHRRLSRYDTMTTAEISALPVADVVSEAAHLYLWVPNALIADGLEVMRAWGFEYKSNLVWAKRRKDGGPDGRGVGFYFRNTTELVLFGVRGKLRTLAPGRRQVNIIETRKREHSRKPDELYEIVEGCSPGPYLELFARYGREGWWVWGDEADADVTPRGKQYPAYR
jgi:N6-adenosine-specific RNA methylase IME4